MEIKVTMKYQHYSSKQFVPTPFCSTSHSTQKRLKKKILASSLKGVVADVIISNLTEN